MFEAADHLRSEFAELEASLADPTVHSDLVRARKIGRRYAELSPLISALDEHATQRGFGCSTGAGDRRPRLCGRGSRA